ncbi:MAG: adenosylcobinamide-GDP ribazoletransferase [Syntrophomonadaceae bacterium]|mgnify:CR=1 FL=1|jgi:adenosylcobinamide-GDP ribazoletransferase|nr:adenosylcobinamide-GDP ribazoletransferase [Syntrophomonadaceae bacterium]
MRSMLLAISFLTIAPVYGNRVADEREFANSLYYYPLVGFIIGMILFAVVRLCEPLGPGIAAEVLILSVWVLITGALHLDGLMDSADGLFSGRAKEQKLEIMKDSRIGAMGAITLVIVILLKVAFLDSLAIADQSWVLLVAPAVGRFMMVYTICRYPYARPGGGLGAAFGGEAGYPKLMGALLLLLAGAWLAQAWTALTAAVITIALGALIAAWIAKQLGGVTGDTFGAVCESSETIFIITAALLVS